MVAGVFLVTRTDQGVSSDKNQVREVILHEDDGETDAEIIIQAIAGLNTSHAVETGAAAVYPAGYFDTVIQIAASPEGPLATINDYIAYTPEVSSDKT